MEKKIVEYKGDMAGFIKYINDITKPKSSNMTNKQIEERISELILEIMANEQKIKEAEKALQQLPQLKEEIKDLISML